MGHTPFTIWLTGFLSGGGCVSLSFWLIGQCDRRRNPHQSKTNQPNRRSKRH